MGNSSKGSFFLLDDFSGEISQVGTTWEGFTDQVMGGVSEQRVVLIQGDDENYIRMTGDVSLENNGGFIQIRLKIAPPFRVFDASGYKGIRLRVRGSGDGYYIFLRTSTTLLPWKFFKSKIPMSRDWQTVFLPWESFGGGDYGSIGTFNPEKLKSLALVAYGQAFRAEVDMTEIGFY